MKAGVFYANQTPAADHGLDTMWAELPLEPAVQARYAPLVQRAAIIRANGAYPEPQSEGYRIITQEMTQETWSAFRSDGEALTGVIENVGAFLAGDAPRPPGWRGPRPRGAPRVGSRPMHLTDLGTIVRADARSFTWGFTGPWLEIVEQLVRHIRQAVHAEMGKPAGEAPKAVLIAAPQVTHVAPEAKSYAVESEVIRDPRPSETKRAGAVLFQLDADPTTRNVTVARQLSAVEERLRRTPPLPQPGPLPIS